MVQFRRSFSLAASLFFACGLIPFQVQGQTKQSKPKVASPPAPLFDVRKKSLAELKDLGGKLVELSKAMPPDKFTWHPDGQGLPTVSELYLLTASQFYHVPSELGAIRAETFEVGEASDSARKPVPRTTPFEKAFTDKLAVTQELFDAVAYFQGAMESLDESDFQKHIKVRDRDTTPDEVLFVMVSDVHDYLSEACDYARMNGIVLPWMEEMQQERQRRGLRAASTSK